MADQFFTLKGGAPPSSSPPAPPGDLPADSNRRTLNDIFDATPWAVRSALRNITRHFSSLLTQEQSGRVQIVLSELFNNIVEHGYSEDGIGKIVLQLQLRGNIMHCRVQDHGKAIPPHCFAALEGHSNRPYPPDLPEGGWGWHLIGDIVEQLDYAREVGQNRLLFHIQLGARTSAVPKTATGAADTGAPKQQKPQFNEKCSG